MSPFSHPALHLLRRYLVEPPAISSFHWTPNKSFGSSLTFLSTSIFSYLSLTLLLHLRLLPPPSLPPPLLRLLSISHNSFLLLLSSAMASATSLSALHHSPSFSHLLCFPPSTPPSGPLFFWAQIFYLSKLYEFFDTALIFFSAGKRLTFLHVYHHAGVVLMAYIWLATSQSLFPLALVTNACVHVVMYCYYLSASCGWRWGRRWKKAVTRLQIGQFVFSFLASGGFLWLHFAGGGCAGAKGWVFNAVFNASLLWLFLRFHRAAYGKDA